VGFGYVLVGTIIESLLLVAMLTQGAVIASTAGDAEADARATALAETVTALALIPLMRLVSVSVPFGGRSEVSQSLVVAAVMLPAIAWALWIARLRTAKFVPRDAVDVLIVALAFPLGSAAYFLLRPESLVEGNGWADLGLAAVAVSVAAIVEELIFRGFVQTAFVRLYGSSAALWSTAAYVISYLAVRPGRFIVLAAALGLLFGWVVHRTGCVASVAASHALLNVALVVLVPSSATHG
jgi:membrane protease YdiL (CAAX protease family)